MNWRVNWFKTEKSFKEWFGWRDIFDWFWKTDRELSENELSDEMGEENKDELGFDSWGIHKFKAKSNPKEK